MNDLTILGLVTVFSVLLGWKVTQFTAQIPGITLRTAEQFGAILALAIPIAALILIVR